MPEIIFDTHGNARCIYSDDAADLLRDVGHIRIARASHVEPDENGKWGADLRQCRGPKLGPFDTRSEALAAEIKWLLDNDVPLPSFDTRKENA